MLYFSGMFLSDGGAVGANEFVRRLSNSLKRMAKMLSYHQQMEIEVSLRLVVPDRFLLSRLLRSSIPIDGQLSMAI